MGKHNLLLVSIVVVFLSPSVFSEATISPDIVVRTVDRTVDLTSQLNKIITKITAENTGKSALKNFVYSLEPDLGGRVAFIKAVSNEAGKSPLKVTQIAGKPGLYWQVEFKESLQPGKTVSFEVECILIDSLVPYPTAITQKERQLVKYSGNAYVYLPYKSLKQTSIFRLSERNVESFTKINPASQSDKSIAYGPYQNVEAFSSEPIVIHFENNSPFLKVTRLERVIEVSHWGNIAVEETIDIVHVGAALKGSFSRYEFQREAHSGVSSVKSFKTVLPVSASDVYYRDDIGNISTSHMKLLADSVEVDLRPRFPLFGGWKTHYLLGYNVPSQDYLYNSGDNYKLRMRVLDHVYDDMVVEELILRIILPENCDQVSLISPFAVTRLADSRHSTYLDTKGRLVISVRATNLVEGHMQDFELSYVFPRIHMLQEPLLVAGALYLLFLLVIIYVRLDFSISKDEAGESKMRVLGLMDRIFHHQESRASAYRQQEELLGKLKASKDVSAYLASMKSVNQLYKNDTAQISEVLAKLKADAPEIAEKVSELQKLDKQLKGVFDQRQSLCVDKLVPGKIGRTPFVEAENNLNKKKEDLMDRINLIVLKSLHY